MIRAVLIALLSGMLIGGGGVGALAYIVLLTSNDRLLGLETDTHRITRDFDMGMKMVGDVVAINNPKRDQQSYNSAKRSGVIGDRRIHGEEQQARPRKPL